MGINLERLKNNLIELGWIGYNGDNSELPVGDKGITRLPFTKEYNEADEFVSSLMESAGLKVDHDSVGNLFATLSSSKNEETIIIGSHIDTVPQGGLFDGNLGVLAALEALQTLKENGYDNNYNLMVAAFIGEEGQEIGGTFGSRCFSGNIELTADEEEFLKKNTDITPADVSEAAVNPDLVKNYLEMHVEQGQVLETEGKTIGIVQGIVGISRYNAAVKGKANHAGTTPMDLRDDALVKASDLVIKLNKIVNRIGGNLVGTIGDMRVEPGAVNVIPGQVDFPIELRDMKKETIDRVIEELKEVTDQQSINIEEFHYEGSVYLAEGVQSLIEKAAKELKYDYKYMISGAGHDANPLSRIAPTGMIFVPSCDGISHSPEEWTDWSDIKKGTEVMMETIKLLDQ